MCSFFLFIFDLLFPLLAQRQRAVSLSAGDGFSSGCQKNGRNEKKRGGGGGREAGCRLIFMASLSGSTGAHEKEGERGGLDGGVGGGRRRQKKKGIAAGVSEGRPLTLSTWVGAVTADPTPTKPKAVTSKRGPSFVLHSQLSVPTAVERGRKGLCST